MTDASQPTGMIINGFGYFGSRLALVIDGQRAGDDVVDASLRGTYAIAAIIEPDAARRRAAQRHFPARPVVEHYAQLDTDQLRQNHATLVMKDNSPPRLRLGLLDWCEAHGVPVLLEKPLAWEPSMLEPYRARSDVAVNFQEMFNPVTTAIKQAIAAHGATIERIEAYRANTLHPERLLGIEPRFGVLGGCVMDKSIHDIHLVIAGLFPECRWAFKPGSVRKADFLLTPDRFEVDDHPRWYDCAGQPGAFDPASTTMAEQSYSLECELLAQPDGQTLALHLGSTWCGLAENHPWPRALPELERADTLMQYPVEHDGLTLKKQNLKYCCLHGHTADRRAITIFANYQKRGYVHPFLWIRTETASGAVETTRTPVVWQLPSTLSFHHFAAAAAGGPAYQDFGSVLRAHEILLAIRAEMIAGSRITEQDQIRRIRSAYQSLCSAGTLSP